MAYTFGQPTPVLAPAKRQGSLVPVYDAGGRITSYRSGLPSEFANTPSVNLATYAPTSAYKPAPTLTGSAPLAVGSAPGSAQDPSSLFKTLSATKSPDVAAAAGALQTTAKDTAAATTKSFNDYLTEAKQQLANEKAAVAADTATFAQVPQDVQAQTGKAITDYAATGAQTNQALIEANKQYADQSQKTLADLQAEQGNYEQKAQALADLSVQRADAQNKLFQAGSGTPTSASSGMTDRAIKAYLDVNVPLQAQLSQNRSNILTNVALPLESQYRTNTAGQLEQVQLPVAGNVANLSIQQANTVAQLKSALAGRSVNEAITYMSQLQIPITLQQQILSGNISVEQALSNLNLGNTFYGLGTDYAPPQFSFPDYTNPAPYAPSAARQAGPVTYGGGTIQSAPGVYAASGGSRATAPQSMTARDIYFRQTGRYPEADPQFSQYAWEQANALAQSSGAWGTGYAPGTPAPASPYGITYAGGVGYGTTPTGPVTQPLSDFS